MGGPDRGRGGGRGLMPTGVQHRWWLAPPAQQDRRRCGSWRSASSRCGSCAASPPSARWARRSPSRARRCAYRSSRPGRSGRGHRVLLRRHRAVEGVRAPIVRAGAVVVDKSNALRMDPTVPLVVPEINAHAATGHRGHPGLPELHDDRHGDAAQAPARRGTAAAGGRDSYQAVSGAGVNGLEELREQTLAWARGEAVAPSTSPIRSPST